MLRTKDWASPSPSGRRWPEGPDEGQSFALTRRFAAPSPKGRGPSKNATSAPKRLRQLAGQNHSLRNLPHGAPSLHALLLKAFVGFFLGEIRLLLKNALGALDQFPSLQRLLGLLNRDVKLRIFEC